MSSSILHDFIRPTGHILREIAVDSEKKWLMQKNLIRAIEYFLFEIQLHGQ